MSDAADVPRMDLQVHTTFSDGALSVDDMVAVAVERGLAWLGITDHYRTTKLSPQCTLLSSQVSGYVEAIRAACLEARGALEVWAGLEIDFCSGRSDLENLPSAVAWDRLDFVLFEYVNDADQGGDPLAGLADLRARIGCRVGLAHTDLGRVFADMPPLELVDALEEHDIFVELCCGERNGKYVGTEPGVNVRKAVGRLLAVERKLARLEGTSSRKVVDLRAEFAELRQAVRLVPAFLDESPYHDEFFSALKGRRVRLSLATDHHGTGEGLGDVEEGVAFLRRYGLTEQLIVNDDQGGRHEPRE